MKTVSLIDSDRIRTKTLASALESSGFEVRPFQDCFQVLEDSFNNPPDIFLISDRGGLASTDLFLSVVKSVPIISNIPVVVFGSGDPIGPLKSGARDYLALPVDPDELCQRIANVLRANSPEGVVGKFSEISLVDLLQLFIAARKSGQIAINVVGGVGSICLDEGQIVSAAFDNYVGEEALLLLLRSTRSEGVFCFRSCKIPEERNIDKRSDHLLLSLAQQIDEN